MVSYMSFLVLMSSLALSGFDNGEMKKAIDRLCDLIADSS
jgi:hypothetical protein